MNNAGLLLINLGTPDGTDYRSVRRYLSEFLSDRRVIEANPLIWRPILEGVVLSLRPQKSGAAYRRIWNEARDESPLRSHTRSQAEKLALRLAPDGVKLAWSMRYGIPTVASAIDALAAQGCDRIVVLPLYPQYSAATTATANDQVFRALMDLRRQPALRTTPSYPDHPLYIAALAGTIRRTLGALDWKPDMLVGSFHGLPKSCIAAGDPYGRECERTMRALRTELGLAEALSPLTYQSRFGPAKWLEPATASTVVELAKDGIRRVALVMPGFLSDCIETLDEIGNELREAFLHAGGEKFCTIPCVNDDDAAIDMLEALARAELVGWMRPAAA